MDRFKFFLNRYKKEVIIGVVLVVFMIGGMGIYFFYGQKQTDKILKEEVMVVEDNPKKEEVIVEEKKMRVDIKGEVQKPGVYNVTEDMRVVDVIQLAGGLTKFADTSVNNLSQKVMDAMVIMIYSKKEVEKFRETKQEEQKVLEEAETIGDGLYNDSVLTKEDMLQNQGEKQKDDSEDSTVNKKISLNAATREELQTLSGIGESKAIAIIEYRSEIGRFEKIEDIMNVRGIGESIFEKIKDNITI